MRIATDSGPDEADIDEPGRPRFLVVVSHGAGGGVGTSDLLAVRDAAVGLGCVVARVLQPYRVRGARVPGSAGRQDAAWLDVTTVHKGGLFGSDYRMLFPADGIGGLKRFFLDTLIEHGKRGLACQPAIVGIGIGGSKDTCVRLGKEAACLRVVGSRNPDPEIARLEDELTALGNYIGIGAMGFAGTSLVVSTHVEIAFSHTGGMPVGIHQFCLSSRRATARIHPDGRVEFRADPQWFTDYYRRESIE